MPPRGGDGRGGLWPGRLARIGRYRHPNPICSRRLGIGRGLGRAVRRRPHGRAARLRAGGVPVGPLGRGGRAAVDGPRPGHRPRDGGHVPGLRARVHLGRCAGRQQRGHVRRRGGRRPRLDDGARIPAPRRRGPSGRRRPGHVGRVPVRAARAGRRPDAWRPSASPTTAGSSPATATSSTGSTATSSSPTTGASDDVRARIAASKFRDLPGFMATPDGHLVFQHHGEGAWFEAIRPIRADRRPGSIGARRQRPATSGMPGRPSRREPALDRLAGEQLVHDHRRRADDPAQQPQRRALDRAGRAWPAAATAGRPSRGSRRAAGRRSAPRRRR